MEEVYRNIFENVVVGADLSKQAKDVKGIANETSALNVAREKEIASIEREARGLEGLTKTNQAAALAVLKSIDAQRGARVEADLARQASEAAATKNKTRFDQNASLIQREGRMLDAAHQENQRRGIESQKREQAMGRIMDLAHAENKKRNRDAEEEHKRGLERDRERKESKLRFLGQRVGLGEAIETGEHASFLGTGFSPQTAAIIAGATAFAFITKQAIEAAHEVGEFAVEMDHLAERTGLNTHEAQLFARGAAIVDVNVGSLTAAMRILSKGLAEGGEEGKKQKKVLQELGIEYEDTAHRLLPFGRIYEQIGEKLGKMPAGPLKDFRTVTLLGRGGLEQLPYLSRMGELSGAVEKSGVIRSEKEIEQGKEYAETLNFLSQQWERLKNFEARPIILTVTQLTKMYNGNYPEHIDYDYDQGTAKSHGPKAKMNEQMEGLMSFADTVSANKLIESRLQKRRNDPRTGLEFQLKEQEDVLSGMRKPVPGTTGKEDADKYYEQEDVTLKLKERIRTKKAIEQVTRELGKALKDEEYGEDRINAAAAEHVRHLKEEGLATAEVLRLVEQVRQSEVRRFERREAQAVMKDEVADKQSERRMEFERSKKETERRVQIAGLEEREPNIASVEDQYKIRIEAARKEGELQRTNLKEQAALIEQTEMDPAKRRLELAANLREIKKATGQEELAVTDAVLQLEIALLRIKKTDRTEAGRDQKAHFDNVRAINDAQLQGAERQARDRAQRDIRSIEAEALPGQEIQTINNIAAARVRAAQLEYDLARNRIIIEAQAAAQLPNETREDKRRIAAEETRLKIEGIRATDELQRQVDDAHYDRMLQFLEIQKRKLMEARDIGGSMFDAAIEGRGMQGIGDVFTRKLKEMGHTVAENLSGEVFNSLKGTLDLGGIFKGQTKIGEDGKEHQTFIGRVLSGTMLAQDSSKNATTLHTTAVVSDTAAMLAHTQAMASRTTVGNKGGLSLPTVFSGQTAGPNLGSNQPGWPWVLNATGTAIGSGSDRRIEREVERPPQKEIAAPIVEAMKSASMAHTTALVSDTAAISAHAQALASVPAQAQINQSVPSVDSKITWLGEPEPKPTVDTNITWLPREPEQQSPQREQTAHPTVTQPAETLATQSQAGSLEHAEAIRADTAAITAHQQSLAAPKEKARIESEVPRPIEAGDRPQPNLEPRPRVVEPPATDNTKIGVVPTLEDEAPKRAAVDHTAAIVSDTAAMSAHARAMTLSRPPTIPAETPKPAPAPQPERQPQRTIERDVVPRPQVEKQIPTIEPLADQAHTAALIADTAALNAHTQALATVAQPTPLAAPLESVTSKITWAGEPERQPTVDSHISWRQEPERSERPTVPLIEQPPKQEMDPGVTRLMAGTTEHTAAVLSDTAAMNAHAQALASPVDRTAASSPRVFDAGPPIGNIPTDQPQPRTIERAPIPDYIAKPTAAIADEVSQSASVEHTAALMSDTAAITAHVQALAIPQPPALRAELPGMWNEDPWLGSQADQQRTIDREIGRPPSSYQPEQEKARDLQATITRALTGTVEHTTAVISDTAAMTAHAQAIESESDGGVNGIGSVFSAPPVFGSGTNDGGIPTGDDPWLGSQAEQQAAIDRDIGRAPGNHQTLYQSRGPFTTAGGRSSVAGGLFNSGANAGTRIESGVATAGTLFAGFEGAKSGIQKGGAKGGFQAASSILGTAAALDPEPISKAVLAIAAFTAGVIGAVLGDPKQIRAKQIEKALETNKFMEPVAINRTQDTSGNFVDYDRFGKLRQSPFSAMPQVSQGYFDYRHHEVVPGTVNSQFGGQSTGPIQVNIHAFDSKSFTDHSEDVADALRYAVQRGHQVSRDIGNAL